MRDIAGILNEERNVMGMMPHPERASDPLMGGTDGLVDSRFAGSRTPAVARPLHPRHMSTITPELIAAHQLTAVGIRQDRRACWAASPPTPNSAFSA